MLRMSGERPGFRLVYACLPMDQQREWEERVRNRPRLRTCLVLSLLTASAFAQKVKVGYDKSADFSKYKSYTWAAPSTPSSRPMLREIVIGSVDHQLKSRGLARVENNGDLILIGNGGMEYGINQAAGTPYVPTYAPPTFDATVWTGASVLMAPYVPEGTLILEFVDRGTNKVVWGGTLTQKLDVEQKQKSLELIDKGIAKLLKQFPPKQSK
jgi:hypothetical protein